MISRRHAIAFSLLLGCAAASASGKGYLGLGVNIDGDGPFWNATLKTVTVSKVVAGSPAEKAGVSVGDRIVEIEGRPVSGAKANDLKPFMEREVGQRVKLGLQKASGEVRHVVVVAGPKPE
jgi:C-terminal processing protease CtpA/Prc